VGLQVEGDSDAKAVAGASHCLDACKSHQQACLLNGHMLSKHSELT
jgi:hypothetical protein